MSSKNNSKPKKIQHSTKINIKLNDEQEESLKIIENNAITFLRGKAGSGKTMVACFYSIDGYLNKKYERIVITRPNVYKNSIGFLKGTLEDKMAPWVAPIYDNMYAILNKQIVDTMVTEGKLLIVPFEYMRGRSFVDSVVIVDEVQNLENEDLLNVITRIGVNSKMILCGDENQIDLSKPHKSSISLLEKMSTSIDEFSYYTLKKNHRHKIVEKILSFMDNKI